MKKRTVFTCSLLALTLMTGFWIAVSARRVRAQSAKDAGATLRVMDESTAKALDELASELDAEDPLSKRFGELLASPEGRLALAGYLNALADAARQQARDLAVPRFIEKHFAKDDDGRLTMRAESAELLSRWVGQSKRMAIRMEKVKQVADDISANLDDSTEAAGLLKRLLSDPQAPMVILLGEMKGGDVIDRYLSEVMTRSLVDQGNGVFRIVDSRREEAAKQIERLERAGPLHVRLKQDLPKLAAEYATDDERHQKLVRYLQHPVTATVVAIQMSEESSGGVSQAVNRLHQHFEEVSEDTANGLKINDPLAWERMQEIFDRVDRVDALLPRVRERLAEISETLSQDDPLTARLAEQMKREPLAVVAAADLPYAESDPGEELRSMLREVLTESNGRYAIKADTETKVTERARELLKQCRQVRRYLREVDDFLNNLDDPSWVGAMGDAARYVIFDQVRKQAEAFRPDPLALMEADLLQRSTDGTFRVRAERREVVRALTEQAEAVQREAELDDF